MNIAYRLRTLARHMMRAAIAAGFLSPRRGPMPITAECFWYSARAYAHAARIARQEA